MQYNSLLIKKLLIKDTVLSRDISMTVDIKNIYVISRKLFFHEITQIYSTK